MQYFNLKILKNQKFQQIAINLSPDIDSDFESLEQLY